MNLYIHLRNSGKSLYDMDSLQIDSVRAIAYSCPVSFAKAHAMSVLKLLFEEEVPDCSDSAQARKHNHEIKRNDILFSLANDRSDYYLGNNIPNPFFEMTSIPYRIPLNTHTSLIISDVYGRKIYTYELDPQKSRIEISMKGFSPGIYFYSIEENKHIIESKKMIIIQ
jgi:hypothetical protein